MSISTYGTLAELDQAYKTIISPAKLNALLTNLGVRSNYFVNETAGDQNLTSAYPNQPAVQTDLILVEDDQAISDDIDFQGSSLDAAGKPTGDFSADKTVIDNTFAKAETIFATDSAYVELTGGSALIKGGYARTFIGDASNDSATVKMFASDEAHSYSYLIGGSGSDSLIGSSSTTGSAVLQAGSGFTTMSGGQGAATMYGGGATTMFAGNHAGQQLYDFNVDTHDTSVGGSHDSMVAGTGGENVLKVVAGQNVLNDRLGHNDSLYAGSGNDTLYGSLNGSSVFLGSGNSSVSSVGNDTIFASGGGSDTITAADGRGSTDTVVFAGHSANEIQALVQAQQVANPGSNSVQISFSNADGSNQTATLNNITHIHFGNG